MTSPSVDRLFGSNSSLAFKAPCKAATTANITLSGAQTIDGVACVAGDRVLVKDQTTASANGIYICDTSTWDRAPDFDGTRDIVQGTRVYVNNGTNYASSEWVLSTANPITLGTTSLTFSRQAMSYITRSSRTATAGQTLFTTDVAYQSGGGGMAVYVDGLRQRVGDDYTETSGTSLTFTYALTAGQEVDSYIGLSIGNLTAASAAAVGLTDTGDYYAGTTVEGVLQEIAGGIAADNGDASATFTNASSSRIQRWNTALTGARTLTLSTSNAKEGAWVLAIRGAGATGASSLTIGSILLTAPGQWVKHVYDAGTAAWIQTEYGYLSSAGIQRVNLVGDGDATLTVGTTYDTLAWVTTLTADRTATLSTTGAWTGARFRIVRAEIATGNFSLIVVTGSTRLARLALGQYCYVEYSGSAWIVTAFGNLRNGLTGLVELRDDFLGEEIDSYKWSSIIGTDMECRQAIVLADQVGGVVRMTSGDDAGATMAINGVQMQSGLNWKANKGGLVAEVRIAIDAITNVCVFIGLTDQVSDLEMPFTLSGVTLTSNATNACGILFDTDATNDNWHAVGVAADVDATMQNLAVAPVAATFETFRIEVSATGVATFYREGGVIGSAMTGAVTASAPLTPIVAVFARGAASRSVDVDEVFVQQQR